LAIIEAKKEKAEGSDIPEI